MTDAIDILASARDQELIALRRRLHARPELSFAEHATTSDLVERLEVAGLEPRVLGVGTGLVCDVVGNAAGPLVVLRADIDALAMPDGTQTEFRSRVEGVAHACGHDAHAAITLGAGLVLRALTEVEPVPGTVRLVFEPGEERVPGGALDVLREGWIDGASAVLGLHCDPKLPLGQVGLRVGALTAAADSVEIVVRGPGGHTSRPQLTVDLIAVMARLVAELPGEILRRLSSEDVVSSADEVVVAFGAAHAGNAANVIPAEGVLRCSVRCRSRQAWDRAQEATQEAIASILAGTGATHDVYYGRGTPPVVNQSAPLACFAEAAAVVVGPEGIVEAPASMGGDTFAWYGEAAPIAYARLGTHVGEGPPHDLHSSTFDLDERAIGIGVRLMVRAALLALQSSAR